MSRLLPLHPEPGRLVPGHRARTAVGATRSSSRTQTGGGSRQTWSHTDRSRGPVLEELEPLVHSRLENIKSALQAVDPGGTGLLSEEDFRQVLKSQLHVSQEQLDATLSEVCGGNGAAVDYMQFLRRFSRAPVACRASRASRASSSSVRRVQQNTSMSLSEIQKHLEQKVGSNLRTMIRVFRLFDYNRQGHIEQHDFHRILDNYCIQLTDKEFQRLWHHYSPSSMATISYTLFLDKLGFGDAYNFKIAPVCTKIAVSSRGTTPGERARQQMQGAESQSSLREAPSLLSQRNLHAVFYDKMCVNSTPLWRALQAFDTTRSGLVARHVLRAVLSSFLFSMNPHTFQKLTSRYGVRATGPVRWKHFLGHFIRRVKEEGNTELHTDGPCDQPALHDETLDFQNIYPQLKQIFHLLDAEETGAITRADLSRLLERPDGAQPLLQHSQITELLGLLDPGHTGVIQLGSLETLSPSIESSPAGNTAAPPSPENTAEPLGTPREIKATSAESKEQKTRDERETKVCVASASQRTVKSLELGEQLSSALAALEVCDHSGYISDTHLHRPSTAAQSAWGRQPSCSPQVHPETPDILGIVFRRMRRRLEQRRTSLAHRIQAIVHSSDAVGLSKTDVQKILEDSWVILDNENFNKFTEGLGFMDGRIERSVFQAKYDVSVSQQAFKGEAGGEDEADPLPTSAEQCLAALKTRIETMHGNNLTAFRLMDRKCKGLADRSDFRVLYNSLGFFCSEPEYERLLDLIGLHPGGNLNFAEFVNVVQNNGNRGTQGASVQEQLHELLAHEARYKWADMSKALCQFDTEGLGRIDKRSLRALLFTYALPITSTEFDQLWLRFDPEGRGSVAVCDFLEKLGFHHEGEPKSQSQKPNQTATRFNAHRPASSDTVSVERIQLRVPLDDNCTRSCREAETASAPPPGSPDAVRQTESLDGLSPDLALSRMQELVTASADNLYKTFSAFDQSRTGTVKALEFRQVLESFCARLSDRQYRHVLTDLELDCDNCTVNWKDFLFKCQSHSLLTLDRALSGSGERGAETTENPGSTEPPQQISGCLYKISEELMDLDASECSVISKEQLRQLCDRHRLTNDQFERLWQMPVTEQGKLQRRDLLGTTPPTHTKAPSISRPEPRETTSATKPRCPNSAGAVLQRTKSAPRCSSRRPASVGGPGTESPLGSMEARLRGAVQRCWKEIRRKCAQEDPHQEGHISTATFLEILQSVNISVTPEHLERLAVKLDLGNNGSVSYQNFLRHFLLNLQPAETTRAFERLKLPLAVTQTSQGVLSKDFVEVMLRTYDAVRSSWSTIRRSFLASDRGRTGRVSVQDFRKVLCHFRVNLSEEEFFHLSSYFDGNATGKICYNTFLWAFLH